MSRLRRVQTSKMMHEWLPVHNMRGHVTGLTQCPGCAHASEDIAHMYRCPHPMMEATRRKALVAMERSLLRRRIPRRVVDALVGIARSQCGANGEYAKRTNFPDTRAAVDEQDKIGYNMMMRGFIAKGWGRALRNMGSTRAGSQTASIVRVVLNEFLDVVWKQRCDVLHQESNKYNVAEDEALTKKLLWYKQHRQEILGRQDWHMTHYSEDGLR